MSSNFTSTELFGFKQVSNSQYILSTYHLLFTFLVVLHFSSSFAFFNFHANPTQQALSCFCFEMNKPRNVEVTYSRSQFVSGIRVSNPGCLVPAPKLCFEGLPFIKLRFHIKNQGLFKIVYKSVFFADLKYYQM